MHLPETRGDRGKKREEIAEVIFQKAAGSGDASDIKNMEPTRSSRSTEQEAREGAWSDARDWA